jgi:Domain of unknown function (DUF4261)
MPEGHSLSFVLLPTSALPSAADFRLAWRDIAKGAAPPTENKWDAQSIEVELDDVTTIATLMPAPVPNQEAEAAAASSVSAMGTRGFSPAPHVAHLAVVSLSPKASPVERLLRHTRVVAALTKASHAIGVYEGNARATHDPAFYVDVVANGPDLPLMLWNGISLAKTPDTVELLTLGMAQLGFPDLLLVGPAGQGNDALLFAFNLLGYVISRGGPIPEGETVGRTAAEKLPVTYVPSPIDPAVRVMKVDLLRPKKGWWPFGRN